VLTVYEALAPTGCCSKWRTAHKFTYSLHQNVLIFKVKRCKQ